jgi:hypothetical protein
MIWRSQKMVCLKVMVKITIEHINVVFENSLMQKHWYYSTTSIWCTKGETLCKASWACVLMLPVLWKITWMQGKTVTPKKTKLKFKNGLERLWSWPKFDFLNRCSDGRSETADAKISSKRDRFTIHMLNSEVGWITDRPFNFSPRFI